MGLCRRLEADRGVCRGASEKYLLLCDAASLWHLLTVLVEVVGRGKALVRLRTADLLAISYSECLLQMSRYEKRDCKRSICISYARLEGCCVYRITKVHPLLTQHSARDGVTPKSAEALPTGTSLLALLRHFRLVFPTSTDDRVLQFNYHFPLLVGGRPGAS